MPSTPQNRPTIKQSIPPLRKTAELNPFFSFIKKSLNWIAFVLSAFAFYFIHRGSVGLGEFCLILCIFTLFGQTYKTKIQPLQSAPADSLQKNKLIVPRNSVLSLGSRNLLKNFGFSLSNSPIWVPSFWFLMVLAAGSYFFLNILAFPSHIWMFPAVGAFSFGTSYWGLLVAGALMVLGLAKIPINRSSFELSFKTARWLLLLIFGLGVFMIAYRPLWPPGNINGDNVIFVGPARYVAQLGNWGYFFDVQLGNSWPVFTGAVDSLIWVIVPWLSGLAVQKLQGVLIEIALILFMYLAGKEAANRRAGLFAATLCAVSHPIICKSVAGCNMNAHLMAVVLALWLFFRAMKNPQISNFLWWGAAVAFSIYTYIINRAFVLVALVGALAWILIQQKDERKMDRPTFFLTFGTLGIFLFYYVYTNYLFASNNFISFAIDSAGTSLPCLALSVLWVLGLYLGPKIFQSGKFPYLSGWIVATWLAMILSFPKMTDPCDYHALINSGVYNHSHFGSINFPYLTALFSDNSSDWPEQHVNGDSFFGPFEFTLGILGLAFTIIRPNLPRLFLSGVFFYYCAIWILSGTQSGRLQPCIGPFLLLAGIAIEQLFAWLCAWTRNRLARVIFIGSFVGLIFWTAQTEFDQIHVQWVDRCVDVDVGVWRHAVWDENHGYHVFLGPNINFWALPYLLYEGRPVEVLRTNNLITLDTNEKLRDVTIYLRKEDPHSVDDQFFERIHTLFPDAKWDDIRGPWDSNPTLYLYAVRCTIPASDLLKPQDLFTIQTVSSPCWTRSYFNTDNGLYPGILDWQSRLAQANTPPPNGCPFSDTELVRYDGDVMVHQEDDYELDCTTSNLTLVEVDGKKIINMIFPHSVNLSYHGPGKIQSSFFHLSRGPHHIQITTYTQNANVLTKLLWRHLGEKKTGTPILNSFSW